MQEADILDRHMADTVETASRALGASLAALHCASATLPAGDALKSSAGLSAAVQRMEHAMSLSAHLLAQGDDASAALECARAMTLADYTERLAAMRMLASQIKAHADAHSGNAS